MPCERALEAGARLAEPGEFTLRAFLNGRIDLPQAEAVRDLIDATTLYQARVAAQQVEGSVSRRIAPVKEQLLELIALLEAGIDFAEDDISVAPAGGDSAPPGAGHRKARANWPRSFQYGDLVRAGADAGHRRPAQCRQEQPLQPRCWNRIAPSSPTSPAPPATWCREIAAIGGIPVKLYDTAGIRESEELVESLGIERSYQAMADADLTLVVIDLSQPFTAEDDELIARAGGRGAGGRQQVRPAARGAELACAGSGLRADGRGNSRTARGDSRGGRAEGRVRAGDGFITSLRHEQLLRESVGLAGEGRDAVAATIPHEMLLLDLYAALRPIDAITGATTADDILNRIFSTFCIGK